MRGARQFGGVFRNTRVVARPQTLLPQGPQQPRALVGAARARATAELAAWIPERSAWFARFQEWGARVHPTPWRMAARSFVPRVDAAWLALDGWFTLGDSDLVLSS